MKYPVGIQTFEKLRDGGFVYVDKTALIYKLVTEGRVYFLSRPRRFGKSLLVSTLKAYFQGKRELFKGLAIDALETEWKDYPVFHIDFNGKDFTDATELDRAIEEFVTGAEKEYGRSENALTTGSRFAYVLAQAKKKYGRGAVVLVDEYDKPLLDVLGTPQEEKNRNTLKAFYGVFRLADESLQFVFLTGVTKFSQVSVFSGFNQPEDISMDTQYDALCGITEDELRRYFTGEIAQLATKKGKSTEEMFREFKDMYDGYHFSEDMTGVYNPFSVLNALKKRRLDDYWFASGTPTYLVRLMEHFDENMDEMTSRYYTKSQFVDYRADVERPLPMLYQSGYLTIADYNARTLRYRLDFPNNEVKNGFVPLITSSYLKPQEETETWIGDVINALDGGDTEEFRKLMTSFLASVPYTERRKNDERERERYFHYTFYLILRMISCYTVYTEKAQSEGRVDCAVEMPDYVYIMEFKLDGTAREAVDQIDAKGYAREYATDPRKLYKIGVNFSTETGTVSDFLAEEQGD